MTNTSKRLLLLAAAVIILGCIYVLLLTHPKSENEDSTSVSLVSIDSDKISQIDVQLDGSDAFRVSVSADGSSTSCTMASGDTDGTYDSDKMNSLLTTASSVSGTLIEESCTDLGKYGLENSQNTVTITQTDGSATTLYLGLQSDVLDGTYCQIDDSSAVYFIPSSTSDVLLQPQIDYLSLLILPTYYSLSNDLQALTVNTLSDGTSFSLKRRDTSELDDSEADLYSRFIITEPQQCDADDSALSNGILGQLQYGLNAEAIADDNASDLSRYGLDRPTASVRLKFSGKAQTILVGDTDGDLIYVMRKGDTTVYQCDAKNYAFLSDDWSTYRSSVLLTFPKTQMQTLTLRQGTSSHTAKITYVPAEENEKADTDMLTGTLDDKELSTEQIDQLYVALTTLRAVSVLETPADGADEILSLSIELTNGSAHHISLCKGGSREYIAEVDGNGFRYTLSQTQIDTLMNAFQTE